uniref:Uncharacterized protein n=1 Tax=Knipowitschia caucasica TaxID=637954 RepID=A0AAV2MJ14_KNICA
MADDKDPLKQLKDLTRLKDQLEEIRLRVEGDIASGAPQEGSVLASPILKGFLAGYVVAKLRSSAILGVLLGTVTVANGKGFMEGYTLIVWTIIAGQAVNGLLMSVVLKHGTGITRLFVISCSMLVNALMSWAVLGLQITPIFLLPVTMIGLAAYLYYS